MKKTFAIALALVLVVSCCCAIFASAEGEDFKVVLNSTVSNDGVVTVTLSVDVNSIKSGVHMESFGATLNYDANALTLTTGTASNGTLRCATQLPTGEDEAWENVTKQRKENDVIVEGIIDVFFGATDEIVELDANHPLLLTFTFKFKGDDADAKISVTDATSTYVPNKSTSQTVTYNGQGATVTVKNPNAASSTPSTSTPSGSETSDSTPSTSTPSGSETSDTTPSDTESGSTDSGEASTGSDSATTDPASSPETGDMGVIWFAVLALVAVAGVAVAVKVRH